MNIKSINSLIFMTLVICVSFSSTLICDDMFGIKRDFQQVLIECNYAPHCIDYVRDVIAEKNPEMRGAVDAFLVNHYHEEYCRAIEKIPSLEGKCMLLDKMGDYLLLTPHAVARGQEGPCLMFSSDGSDRGGLGLRFKALQQVKAEVEEGMKKAS